MPKPLDEEELSTLIRLAKRVLWSDRDMRQKLQAQKLHILPANFYSSIPSVDDYENSFEFLGADRTEGSYLSPTVFDLGRTSFFLETIGKYAHEFDPPQQATGDTPPQFSWDNSSFSYMDAMSYYCILRHLKPSKVIEIGAGNSTLVADMAIRKNGSGELMIIEPYPADYLQEIESVTSIRRSFVQQINLVELQDMVESAQILFIDSTHTVKVGSDCLYIYLKLLPSIATNLTVHAHDIALPYALPIKNLDRHVYWTEQYLLYAYLLDNPKTKVLMGSNYAQKKLPALSKQTMCDRYADGGGSLWFEYRG